MKAPAKVAHLTLVVDRSGSMSSIRGDIISGINSLLQEQKKQDGECLLTIHQFDTGGFDTLVDAMGLNDVREVDESDFLPRGGTPLLDAVGRTLSLAQVRSEAHSDEAPVICVITDGQENSSREYTKDAVKKLIAQKEAQGWTILYIGANVDAFAEASSMGFAAAGTQNYVADQQGTAAVFASVSAGMTNSRLRAAGGQSVSTSDFYVNETGKAAEKDHQARTQSPKLEASETSRSWKK